MVVYSKDLSVLVVGKYESQTSTLIASARKHYPNAEILVSTWSDVTLNIVGVHKVVYCNDPGGEIFDDSEKKVNNLNRILVLSQEGLKHCSRKYTLRVRSDMLITSNSLLFLTDYLGNRCVEMSLFENRIYMYPLFSIRKDYRNGIGLHTPYHVSDWCHFGLTSDLKELFNLPLVDEPDFSRYFERHHKKIKGDIFYSRLWKMSPEQYITSSNAKKTQRISNFETYLDTSKVIMKDSDLFILSNFVCFSVDEWGIKIQKEQYRNIKMAFEYGTLDYYHKKLLTDNAKINEDLFNKINVDQFTWFQRLEYRLLKAIKTHGFFYIFTGIARKIRFYLNYVLQRE